MFLFLADWIFQAEGERRNGGTDKGLCQRFGRRLPNVCIIIVQQWTTLCGTYAALGKGIYLKAYFFSFKPAKEKAYLIKTSYDTKESYLLDENVTE
jgi:hypothetical protein